MRTTNANLGPGEMATALCPAGDSVLGGGYVPTDAPAVGDGAMVASWPTALGTETPGWAVQRNTAGGTADYLVYAICAKVAS